MRVGLFNDSYDVIVLLDVFYNFMLCGFVAGSHLVKYMGGMTQVGVENLKVFV